MSRNNAILAFIATAVLLRAGSPQHGDGRGGLAIHVITSEENPVAGASIIVLCQGSPEPRTGVTDDLGWWRTKALPVGPASVEVQKDGFQLVHHKLQFKGRTALTVTLPQSGEAIAEVESTEIGETIPGDKLERLPLSDRRSMNAVGTTGASVFLSYESGGKASFSLGGGRAQSQAFSIDGGNGQSMRLGSGHTEFDPAVEELSELRVVSNGYSAEHGGSAGGMLSAKIKSGSNRYRGSLFEFLRNDALDAPNYFAPVDGTDKIKAPLRYNVFGGTIGGPVVRDRAFFFASYEGGRRIEGSTRVMTVPTRLEREGNFSASVNTQGRTVAIYDPFSTRYQNGRAVRDPFAGNVIPASRIDAVARNLIAFYPEANTAPVGVTNANNFTGNSAQQFVRDHLTLKGDYLVSQADRVSMRYVYDVNDQNVRSVYPIPAADNQTNNLNNSHNAFASWTRTAGTSMNDVRFTWSRRNSHQVSNGVGEDWPSKIGLTGVPDAAFPRFQASGYAPLGSANQERIQFPVVQWQMLDILSVRRGAHNLKFGFEFRPSHNVERDLATQSGSFTFNPQGTGQPGLSGSGNSFASLLTGYTYSFTQRMTETLERSSHYLAGFVQDDWQVRPSLSLNFGLRWEVDTAMHDANHRMNGFDFEALNPVSGTPGVVRFAGVEGWPDTLYRTDWNNIGPRAGFAWRVPGGKNTVLRGGYGIFFGHPFDRGVTTAASLGFELSSRLVSPDNGVTAPFILAQGVPVAATAPVLDDSFGAVLPGQTPTTSVAYFDANRATGYAHQYHLSLQQPMPGKTVLHLSFLGNLGRKLPGGNLSVNQIPMELLGPGATQVLRPYPQFADVQVLAPSFGISSYQGGLARLERRFLGGLQLSASYTWSKALANVDGGEGKARNGSGSSYSNLYDRDADWGPSDSDIRHRFTWSSTWDVPLGHGRRWLASGPLAWVAGGWALGSIVTMQSAPPFTVTTQVNSTGAFSAGPLRADVLGNPTLPADRRTTALWFDTSMLAQPAPYTFGNQGVNVLRGDSLVNFDLSILRDFRVSERFRAQIRGEVYNAFNHPSFGLPGSTFGAPGFGVIDSALPARRVQLALRLLF